VPPILVSIPSPADITHAGICIALDGAYREVAVGVLLARSFTAQLHGRGYPDLASLVVHEADASLHGEVNADGGSNVTAINEKSAVDTKDRKD